MTGRVELDVTGLVVAAGFIDLHSHVSDLGGLRLQALDGTTTALELEAGVTPVAAAYDAAAAAGRPINYGFAASWALARMAAVAGLPLTAGLGTFLASIANPAWQHPAGAGQLRALLTRLTADLSDGPWASAYCSVTRRPSVPGSSSGWPNWLLPPGCRRSRTPGT